jgi:hypothetical protein
MTFDGKFKFYDKNRVNKDATYAFTTADTDTASILYDGIRSRQLTSVSSADGVAEVWEITFDQARDIDTIMLFNHNFDTFTIQYKNGGAATDFSPAISESSFTETDTIYEVTSQTCTAIVVSCSNTQDTGEKLLGLLYAFELLGTVENNPTGERPERAESANEVTVDTGGIRKTVFGRKWRAKYDWKPASDNDQTLLRSLSERNEPFYTYPSGGVGQDEWGYRKYDLFSSVYANEYKPRLRSELFDVGVDISVEFRET